MLNVLLVDDHAIVRMGLKEILRTAFENVSVGEAGNGEEALRQARSRAWDVVVLDITMPGMNGLEALKRLKQEQPRLPVIMLSMHSGSHYIGWSFKAGAAGYVCKEHAPEELVAALEAVLGGGIYVSESLGVSIDAEG